MGVVALAWRRCWGCVVPLLVVDDVGLGDLVEPCRSPLPCLRPSRWWWAVLSMRDQEPRRWTLGVVLAVPLPCVMWWYWRSDPSVCLGALGATELSAPQPLTGILADPAHSFRRLGGRPSAARSACLSAVTHSSALRAFHARKLENLNHSHG